MTTTLWILWRLFRAVRYIIKCTFEFQSFVISPAYQYIKNITESITFPYSEYKGPSIIPNLDNNYLKSMELLRDYEISNGKKGTLVLKVNESFDWYIWQYISALFMTYDQNKINQALSLQGKLSTSTRMMCMVFHKENYSHYTYLAGNLAYYLSENRYYYFEEKLAHFQMQQNANVDGLIFVLQEEQKRLIEFDAYYSDLLYLAEEIEGKNINGYSPILSCHYLFNYSCMASRVLLNNNINLDWIKIFMQIDKTDEDILKLAIRLAEIATKYKKTAPLIEIYNNIKNDIGHIDEGTINLYYYIKKEQNFAISYEKSQQFVSLKTKEELNYFVEFLLSEEFDEYFDATWEQKKDLLRNVRRIQYKSHVDRFLLSWLRCIAFDVSILINILEKENPLEKSRIINKDKSLLPTNLGEVFERYLVVSDIQFVLRHGLIQSSEYQIIFSTMSMFFLLGIRRRYVDDKNLQILEVVDNIYKNSNLSIRNVKSIKEIAKLWRDSPKGIESNNEAIRELCLNYGMSFEDLKNFYIEFLTCLEDQADGVMQNKILIAPLDEDAIEEFKTILHKRAEEPLRNNQFKVEVVQDLNEKRSSYRFMSIEREWFIKADTGVHYVRDSLDQRFFLKYQHYLTHNQDKKMIIFEGDKPEIIFKHKVVGNKIWFYCEYNFYFED